MSYSASHPGLCCGVGFQHHGTPSGDNVKFENHEVYIAKPPSEKDNKYGILLCPDVIGHNYVNCQLIADQFAKTGGYTVVAPDLFQGDPVELNPPKDFSFPKWLSKHTEVEIDEIVSDVLIHMRSTLDLKKIGGVGYCLGGKYVVRFLTSNESKPTAYLDAGFVAHPSLVTEQEWWAITFPISIAASETDGIFPVEKRIEAEKILNQKIIRRNTQPPVPWQINLFSGVDHGFAIRGDDQNRQVKFAKESAFLQALCWFHEHLNIG